MPRTSRVLCLVCSLPHVPRTLRVLMPQVPRALRALVPYVLRALRALCTFANHVLRALQAPRTCAFCALAPHVLCILHLMCFIPI